MSSIVIKNKDEILSANMPAKENDFELSRGGIKKISMIQNDVKEILKYLDPTEVDRIVNELKQVPTPNDYAKVLKSIDFLKASRRVYNKIRTMCNSLDGNFSFPISLIVVKEFLYNYFFNKLMKYDDVKYLEIMNIEGLKDEILKIIGGDFPETSHINGIYNLSLQIVSKTTEESYKRKQKHLCFDCQNAWPRKCPKIADLNKKPIEEYDFIVSGYQSFDDAEKPEDFIITSCENFKNDKNKQKTLK